MSRPGTGEASVAAVVLAAGLGSRFGAAPKMLAELEGKPLVRHVAEAALASRAKPVLVVVGSAGDRVKAALAGLEVETVDNERFAEGLSTSVQAGFRALPATAQAALVLLGDMPRVTSDLMDRLIEAWIPARCGAVVPTCGGRRGNPVLLSRALEPAIMALAGDRGAGPLLSRTTDVLELSVADPGVLADVDTPEALGELSVESGLTGRTSWPR